MVLLLQEMVLPSPHFSLPLFFCTVFAPLFVELDLRPDLFENKALDLLPVTFLPDQLLALTTGVATGLVTLAQGQSRNITSEPPIFAGARQHQHSVPERRGTAGLNHQSRSQATALPLSPLLPPHPRGPRGSPLRGDGCTSAGPGERSSPFSQHGDSAYGR